jgi:hypothetical protein
VREYTDDAITQRFGALDAAALNELRRLPCIFAVERGAAAPRFGVIRNVTVRSDAVRVEYDLLNIDPFLSAGDLETLRSALDIGDWEMNRTHWAVKNVDLERVLRPLGIELPFWARAVARRADITTHVFDVGLSFPGEARPFVEQVARELEDHLGTDACFYDNRYQAQLARPSLDTLLQDIYRRRSKLIVVFFGGHYQTKDWCGVEFRAIKEILMARQHDRIMFVKMDDEPVDGIFATDGYIDARRFDPRSVALFIADRVGRLA